MKLETQFHWIVLIVVLTACSAESTDLPTKPTFNDATEPEISTVVSPIATVAPIPTPTDIVVVQPTLEEIKWATYIFGVGVSFEYPEDWIVRYSQEDSVEFLGFPHLPYNVRVDVYHRPIKDKAIADPHTWVPNEGRYEVLWERPISIENADGLEFIWGIPAENQIGGFLIAIYYSELHELEVRLSTDAASIPTESDKFDVFEYMVESVRIAP